MDKNNFKSCLSSSQARLASIQFGESGSLAIDQSPVAECNINPRTGFPYTDMQKVMIQTDIAERRRLLDNLPSFMADFLPDDIGEEDALKYCQPSNMQLPSEYADFVSAKIQADYDKTKENEENKVWDDLVNLKPVETKPSETPSETKNE